MPSSTGSSSSDDVSSAPRLHYADKPQLSSDTLGHPLSFEVDEDKLKPRLPGMNVTTPILPMESIRSPIANHRSPLTKSATAPLPPGVHKQRFRSAVHRVITMRRASTLLSTGRIGAEPGIDPRRASADMHHGHIYQRCAIEIVDYSVTKCSVGRMTNRELVGMLGSPEASQREPWARVRWINVDGISWDVLRALAIRYGASIRLTL